jgi:phosphate-selective porin OprO/OprP
LWEDDGKRFLHLAATYRHRSRDDGFLSYQGRAESNVSQVYVDTGDIAADHANHFGFELLANHGPWSLLAEYIQAQVHGTSTRYDFSGWYATGSWVITGETRPYDRSVGYARRIMPEQYWGAWELVARVGRIDLVDGDIDGGKLERYSAGLNWWATRHWKMGITIGSNRLDKDGRVGHSESYLLRFQWIH